LDAHGLVRSSVFMHHSDSENGILACGYCRDGCSCSVREGIRECEAEGEGSSMVNRKPSLSHWKCFANAMSHVPMCVAVAQFLLVDNMLYLVNGNCLFLAHMTHLRNQLFCS